MKKLIILAIFSLLANIVNAQTKVDTLTNIKVVQLTNVGLQSSVIINKIKNSFTDFDVSTEALIVLNCKGVVVEVLNEMMNTITLKNSTVATKMDSKYIKTTHKSGIYYYNPVDGITPIREMKTLKTNGYRSNEDGVYGEADASILAMFSNAKSKQQIIEKKPIFYFSINESNYVKPGWYENVHSPNEFILVKLIEKRRLRLLKINSFSTESITRTRSCVVLKKYKYPFDYVIVADGIYKITFKEPLEVGEYCFVFLTDTDKVFDFGIH